MIFREGAEPRTKGGMLTHAMPMLDFQRVQRFAQEILEKQPAVAPRRYVLGIAGIPGSGKSTLAQELWATLNRTSPGPVTALVPMDGFHLRNAELDARGLRSRKGSPITFDATAYIELLRQARDSSPEKPLRFPVYDRALHEPVLRDMPEQTIAPETRIVITEGNYLLLDREPWRELAGVLDACWFIDTPIEQSKQWIIARHIRGGRSEADAIAHYQLNDLPNAQFVLEHLRKPDRVLRLVSETQ